MRVLVHPADTGACGHYRLIWPSVMLAGNGYDVRCGDPDVKTEDWPEDMKVYGVWMREESGEERMLQLQQPPDADVLVVQRPLNIHMVDLARHVRNTRCALVVELDDDFTSIHPQNVSFWNTHPRLNPKRSTRNILATIELADLVTVSTPALRDVYQRHTTAPVVVVPNYVPNWYLDVQKAGLARPADYEGRLLLGWSGSIETHPQDLQAVGGAVAQVLQANDHVRLTVVGTGKGVARAFGTKAGGEFLTTGWVPLRQYPSIMKELDVGMVPLKLDRFNEGKSWLKGLEWASLGVPFVATPTQQYLMLYARGAGQVARNPREWRGILTKMVRHDDYRQELADRGRMAAQTLLLGNHLERWMNAWREAASLKARSRTSVPTGLPFVV